MFIRPDREPVDPVLSFDWLIGDLGVSRATFHRAIKPTLPVIVLSPRRRGVRRSDYEEWKRARVRGPQGR